MGMLLVGLAWQSLTQPSPKKRALKSIFKVSLFGGDLEGATGAQAGGDKLWQ